MKQSKTIRIMDLIKRGVIPKSKLYKKTSFWNGNKGFIIPILCWFVSERLKGQFSTLLFLQTQKYKTQELSLKRLKLQLKKKRESLLWLIPWTEDSFNLYSPVVHFRQHNPTTSTVALSFQLPPLNIQNAFRSCIEAL